MSTAESIHFHNSQAHLDSSNEVLNLHRARVLRSQPASNMMAREGQLNLIRDIVLTHAAKDARTTRINIRYLPFE